jgi:TRAP-type transport system small permease protein
MMRALACFDRAVQRLTAALVVASLAAMAFVVIVLVVARYGFGIAMFWGEELARYLMIYMALLGGAVAIRADQHPRLTIFVDMLPESWRRVLGLFLGLLLAATFVVLFVQGLDIALNEGRMTTPALRIPYFWIFMAVPAGAAIMLLQLLLGNVMPNANPVNADDDVQEVVE